MINPKFCVENQMVYFIEKSDGSLHKFLGINATVDFIETLEIGEEFNIYMVDAMTRAWRKKGTQPDPFPEDKEYKENYHKRFQFGDDSK